MTFAADFIIRGDVAYTNEKVEFISLDEDENDNPIVVGIIPDSYIDNPDFEVVGDVELEELLVEDSSGNLTFKPGYDTVVVVTKKEWITAEGVSYIGDSFITTFNESGIIGVTLRYYSETFNYEGRLFQYRIAEPKDVKIRSMFYRILTDNYPLFEKAYNEELDDMFFAFSNFFDRMYRDNKRVFDNIDVHAMAPELLEYMAVTLGHTEDYVKKVGADVNSPEFGDYDIYQRIRKGLATDQEIETFRRFLLFSAELFNKKGTPNDIIALLSFYNIFSKVEELWTKTWGTEPFGPLYETFVGLDKFVDNKLDLRWLDLRVIGNDNDKGHFIHGFNSFVVDSYHHVQKIEFPTDVHETVDGGYLFKIEAGPEYVRDVRREDGETLVDNNVDDDVLHYEIIKNNGELFLFVDEEVLDYGDRLSVSYRTSVEEPLDSLVAHTETSAKDLDALVTFKVHDIEPQLKNENFRLPEDEIFVVTRGIKSEETDIYANFNDYYRIGLNTRRKTFSVSRIFENEKNRQLVNQNINLTGDKDNLVWEGLILGDDGDVYEFKKNVQYQIKVVINGTKLSVYFREADTYQEIRDNIAADIGGTPFGEMNQEWNCLVEALELDVDQASVLSMDSNGDEVVSVEYVPIKSKGMFGVGARTSIIEVAEIGINNLDMDDTLYNTVEKELEVKPKYLEWQSRLLALYNSYENDTNSFTEVIDDDFDPLVRDYEISEELAKALQFLYFDDATVTELLASRYTLIFDEDYVSENFNDGEDVKEKIMIPVGEQPTLSLIEQRVQGRQFYKDAFGQDSVSVPGFANANYTPTLGDYKTVPFDSFSYLDRTDNGFGNDLYLSNKMMEYKNSDENIWIRGVWEEAAPLSTSWSQFDGTISLIDGTTYSNRMFFPIVYEHPEYTRVLGVRFRHCADIQTLIDRVTFETDTEVPLYGSFVFEMPEEAVKFRANQEYEFEAADTPGHIKFRAFLPLGVLNPDIQNYSLGVEYMHHMNFSGASNISLDGVYIRYPSTNFIYHDSENRIELETTNPFERKDKGLSCRYFLNAEFSLTSKLEDFEVPDVKNKVPHKYMMDLSFRKMLKSLEKEGGYNPDMFLDEDGNRLPDQEILDIIYDQWNWWKPERVYRKRDFLELQNDNNNSITTGFNFDPSINQAKSFFGQKFEASQYPEGVPSQRFKITDGAINSKTTYYAKITVRQHWSGYNGVSLTAGFDGESFVHNRPLTPEDYDRLRVQGAEEDQPTSHIMSPVNECNEYLIPISWYDEHEGDTIEWGNYIVGVHGTDRDPSVTLTPFGLMTWMFQHANGKINIEEFTDSVGQVTSGWTVADWNERFWDVVRIEFITEEVPTDKYKLMDEFGFTTQYAPRTGAYIEVDHNIGALPWYVGGKSLLVPSDFGGYYFTIPREIKPFRNWNEEVRRLSLYNYIVPASLYTFSTPTTITLSDDEIFDSFEGADFNARTFFDLFFESNDFENINDNFEDVREINYTVYENTEGDKYELAVRRPSATVAFGIPDENGDTEDPFYDIVNVDGKPSFKRVDDATITKFDPRRLGTNPGDDCNVEDDDNGGYKKTIYFVDSKNEVFDVTATVQFDNQLNEIKNYNGKRFEFIIKADNNFNSISQKYNVEEYYFVGIGTFGFDIALGVARYDFFNDTIQRTFLAGFGDFNTRNVKTGTWYDLRVSVDDQYIRVFFNEKGQRDRLVINYNVEPSRKDDPDRYLKGEFEELLYLVMGLENMDITYPDKLLDKTNEVFFQDNWNEDYAKSIRPAGPLAGMRVFNDLTYIGEISYDAKIQDNRKYGQVYDVTDISEVIDKIRVQYNPPGRVLFSSKTLNNTVVVLIGTNLYYRLSGKDVTEFSDDVDEVFIYRDKVIVRFRCNKSNIVIIDDDFTFTRNLFVKDSSINVDHIFRYKEFTNRKIDRIWVADGNLHVEFVSLGAECNPWGFSVWGDPVWGCFNACLFD